MTLDDYATAVYEGAPNFATWVMALWVSGGIKESEAMRQHLLPLIQNRDAQTLRAEFLQVLSAWQAGEDLSRYQLAHSWLGQEVVRGIVADWMSLFTTTLGDWSRIYRSREGDRPTSTGADLLFQVAFRFANQAISAHLSMIDWEAMLDQLAQKTGAAQEQEQE